MSRVQLPDSSADLSPSERKKLERLAESDLPCSELAATYLEVHDE